MTQLPGSTSAQACYWNGMTARGMSHLNSRAGSCMGSVTIMVQRRKLSKDLVTISVYPSAEPVLQTNGLFENEPVLRPFFRGKSWQNLPFSAKNVSKHGREKALFATGFIKMCQAPWLASSYIGQEGGSGKEVEGRRFKVEESRPKVLGLSSSTFDLQLFDS